MPETASTRDLDTCDVPPDAYKVAAAAAAVDGPLDKEKQRLVRHVLAALARTNYLTRSIAESADYSGPLWTADRLRAELLTMRAARDQNAEEIDRLAVWLLNYAPDEIHADADDPSAVGTVLRLLDRARFDEQRPPAPVLSIVPDDVEVPPDLAADMAAIAQQYRGLEYDADDRPEEVAAVVAAARAAGLVPVPSTTITPRSYRGCTPPTPAVAPPVVRSGLGQLVTNAARRTPDDTVEGIVSAMATKIQDQARPYIVAAFMSGVASTAGGADGGGSDRE